MARDAYEVLGVTTSATDDEIKRAYRRLARECHPDANPDDPQAAERFKELSEAYESVRDPERRRQYDMFGPSGGPGGAGAAGNPFGQGGFGLNDLFDAFFSGDVFGGAGRGQGGPRRGPDVETAMELTLAEVVTGVRRTVEMRMPVECETCGGSGAQAGTHPSQCSTCGGAGEVRQVRKSLLGQIMTAGPCPKCSGLGTTIDHPCETCRGDGRVSGTRAIDVEVPAGIDDAQRLRLAGRGPAAPRGGTPGDLFVAVRVAPNPEFERHGDDLLHRLPVSIVQAALGARIPFETFDGPRDIEVQSGTQPGARIRLQGLGVPSLRSGRRGDLYVEVDVKVPTNLNPEQAELLAQLAALRGEEVTPPHDGLFSRIRSAFRP
jgi:molecular chaperone DnaJ